MRDLVVEQTVHGYRDGHELLGSSFPVPREARRLLLAMSDLSGPGFVDDFDGYLTGYPIGAIAKYAFARTWYAPERERPGCVWTHTLLVDFSDIPLLDSPRALFKFFHKPTAVEKTKRYEKRLTVPLAGSGMPSEQIDRRIAMRLLAALYDSPSPVLLQASSGCEHDEMILALWSQQWPRLRRGFSFSTGSFSFRSVGKVPVDLQVVPTERWSRVLRSERSARAVELQSADEDVDREEWLVASIADLEQGGSPLRTFMRTYGADIDGYREGFRALAQCFISRERVRRRRVSFDEFVASVGKGFPGRDNAVLLKRVLFGPDLRCEIEESLGVSERDRILAALRTKYESAFDFRQSEIEKRAWQFAQVQSPDGVRFLQELLESPLNQTGSRVVDEALGRMGVVGLGALRESDVSVFERVLTGRPSLFYESDLWRAPYHLQHACMDVASKHGATLVKIDRLVGSALSAGSTAIAEDVFAAWGGKAVCAVLDWLDDTTSEDRVLGERWCNQLRCYVAEVLTWLSSEGRPSRPETLSVLPDTVDVGSELLDKVPTTTLASWVQRTRGSEGHGLVETAAFLMAIGLERSDEGASAVVVNAFPSVHEALLRNRLSWRAWSWLEPQMPSRNWFFALDWDKADKLRRALLVRFLENEWPAEHLRLAAYSEETTKYLRDTASRSDDWGRIVRQGLG